MSAGSSQSTGAARLPGCAPGPTPRELRDEFADPADLGDQHRDRVLPLHRIIQHGGIQGPVLAGDHPSLGNHHPHRVRRSVAGRPTSGACLRHNVITVGWNPSSSVNARPAAAFPAMWCSSAPDRFPVLLCLQGLEDHHRGDHVRGNLNAWIRAEMGADQRTSHRGTESGDAWRAGHAPSPGPADGRAGPQHPAVHDQDETSLASPQFFST